MITKENLLGHIYADAVQYINGEEGKAADDAIAAAKLEVKAYLSRYDTDATLAADNPLLDVLVRDVAVWHFIVLGNPTIEKEYRLERYERAVRFLNDVQKGNITLPNAVELQPTEANPSPSAEVSILADKRRKNQF